jgi:hypothetical protein
MLWYCRFRWQPGVGAQQASESSPWQEKNGEWRRRRLPI